MRIDKLAMTSREALQTAMSTAADAQAGAVEPIHLLSALLGAGERNISVIIERIGADPAQLARSTQDAIDHAPKVSGEGQQMGLSNELVRVIEKAEKKAAATSEDPAEPQPGEAPSEPAEDKPARRTRRRATAKSAAPSPENSSDTPEESA